jgi:acyl carrier protein
MTTIEQIVDIASALAPRGCPVTAASSLDDLALDSLECMVLTAEIEDRFDIVIGCGDRVSCESLADLAAIVDGKLGHAAHPEFALAA